MIHLYFLRAAATGVVLHDRFTGFSESPVFDRFDAWNLHFRFQMHLFGTRRNPLYKRKHLGRVLEAQDRKSTLFDKKLWIQLQRLASHKIHFRCKILRSRRKCMEIMKCVTISASNACPVCELPWFWGPRTLKPKKSVNSVKFSGFCGKLWKSQYFIGFLIFVEKCDSGGSGWKYIWGNL